MRIYTNKGEWIISAPLSSELAFDTPPQHANQLTHIGVVPSRTDILYIRRCVRAQGALMHTQLDMDVSGSHRQIITLEAALCAAMGFAPRPISPGSSQRPSIEKSRRDIIRCVQCFLRRRRNAIVAYKIRTLGLHFISCIH